MIKKNKFPTKCRECGEKVETLDNLIQHANNKHENNLLVCGGIEQIGGNDGIIETQNATKIDFIKNEHDELNGDMEKYYHAKYIKYKQKYLDLYNKSQTLNITHVYMRWQNIWILYMVSNNDRNDQCWSKWLIWRKNKSY